MTEFNTMLVELDSLVDTRLSLLYLLFPEEELKDILSNDYYSRTEDAFGDVNMVDFKRLYDMRDKTLLEETIVTNIASLMMDFIKQGIITSQDGLVPTTPRVLVNCYPYRLSQEELDKLKIAITYITKEIVNVDMIYEPLEKLTPHWLKTKGVTLWVQYHYHEWLQKMSEPRIPMAKAIFETQSCPDITLMAPRLNFNPESTQDTIAKATARVGSDPWTSLEQLAKLHIDLRFLSPQMFSSVIDITDRTNILSGLDLDAMIPEELKSEDLVTSTKEMYRKIFDERHPAE